MRRGTHGSRRATWPLAAAILLAACGGSNGSPDAVVPANFIALGTLPGYASSAVEALSGDGTVAVGTASTGAGGQQAWRWQASSGLTAIGFLPGGTRSRATAVSTSGASILVTGDSVGAGVNAPAAVYVWSGAQGLLSVEPLGGSTLCSAGGMSGDGAVVVGVCLDRNNTGFRWTRGTGSVGLSQFGGGSNMQSSALAVSRDGSTVVGVGHPSLTGAVRWAADGSAVVIGKLPGDASGQADAVSDDGRLVAGTSISDSGVPQAFRWTAAEGMSSLGSRGFVDSQARAVSGDGKVIVGCATTAEGKVAFIWDAAHGMRSLQSALQADHGTVIDGWQLTCASAISANARVLAGYGSNPQGRMEAWIVELPG